MTEMYFEIYPYSKGDYRWRVKASNGKTIADLGEGYRNRSDCEYGISFLKNHARNAPVQKLIH
jgi:uncharacterized protein YegP (UPF0339 family)